MDQKHNQTIVFNNQLNKQFYCLVTASNIYENNEVVQKIQVWTDVSEQKKYEQQYKEVINNAFDNIYTTNYKGEYTYVNTSFLKNMGCKKSDILGRHFSESIHPDYRAEVIEFYKKQFEEKTLLRITNY